MGECELYGGHLVQINDLKEYNCLLRHGCKRYQFHQCTDGTDISFYAPRVGCGCANCMNSDKGDAFIFCIGKNHPEYRGNYCDQISSNEWKFICEADI